MVAIGLSEGWPLGLEHDELVVGAGRDAMRGGENQVARNRGAAAKAVLARQHHHRMREFRRGLRPADHRGGGNGAGQDDQGSNRARHCGVISPFWLDAVNINRNTDAWFVWITARAAAVM